MRLLPKEVPWDLSTIASRLRVALPETTGWRLSEPAKPTAALSKHGKIATLYLNRTLQRVGAIMPPLVFRLYKHCTKIKHFSEIWSFIQS